jgi:hypothetical protein
MLEKWMCQECRTTHYGLPLNEPCPICPIRHDETLAMQQQTPFRQVQDWLVCNPDRAEAVLQRLKERVSRNHLS